MKSSTVTSRQTQCNFKNIQDIDENLPQEQETPSMVSRKKSLRQLNKEIFLEFCSNTSIHGFQYFGQQRPRKEILFWIVVFVASIYVCVSIIVKIYVKWDTTPVIITLSEKSTPIWSIPFPAVTICPVTKRAKNRTDSSFREQFEYFTTYIKSGEIFASNFTQTDLEDYLTLRLVCPIAYVDDEEMANYTHPSLDYIQVLDRMLPKWPFYDMMWCGDVVDYNNMLKQVYMTEGMCYTFNGLKTFDVYRENTVQYKKALNENCSDNCSDTQYSPLNWSLDKGYPSDSPVETYPKTVLNSGITGSLILELESVKDEVDYSCTGDERGFRVLLHSPDDIPLFTSHWVDVSVDRKTVIAVKPKMITTSAEVAAYEPRQRQCYMESERQLRFFKIYTQNNCQLECLTNFSLKECDCVSFAMPRSPEMPVCDYDKLVCYDEAMYNLMLRQFSSSGKGTNRLEAPCNCMPVCSSLEYDAETSDLTLTSENWMKAIGSADLLDGVNLSRLVIYFKENQFITSRRSELYGLTELLANFGGVFGLFMGVSILSVIEMVYHFTLRMWSNMTRQRL